MLTICGRPVPTRNTDFGVSFQLHSQRIKTDSAFLQHLRDGFTRALQARQKKAAKDGKLSADDEEVR